MGAKEFMLRNKSTFAIIALAGLLFLLGALMLKMSFSNYSPRELAPKNISANFTTVLPEEPASPGPNCTPDYGLAYTYKVQSPTPDGYMLMFVSYAYSGESEVLGKRARLITITTNSTLRGTAMGTTSRIWLDYYTNECIKSELDAGTGNVFPMDCRNTRFSMISVPCAEQLVGFSPKGNETVKVPAGEFATERLEKEGNQTIWVAKGVRIPVKFTFMSMGSYAVAELYKYEEK